MNDHPVLRPLFVALALTFALAGLALTAARPLCAGLEGGLLALGQRLGASDAGEVTWIDIGGADRGALATAVEKLHAARARVIVLATPLETPAGSADLERVRGFLDSAEASADPQLHARLQSWAQELDHDARLERAIAAAGNVVLLAHAGDAPPPEETEDADPERARAHGVPALAGGDLLTSLAVAPPLARLASVARAVGVEPTLPADADGVHRREAAVVGDAGGGLPSLAAAAWLVRHDTAPAQARWHGGRLEAGAVVRRVDGDGGYAPWYGGRLRGPTAPPRRPLAALLGGTVAPAALAGRTVVLAPATPALRTPTGTAPSGAVLAARIASFEAGDFARRPLWAWLVVGLLLLATPVVAAALALRGRLGLSVGAGLGGALALGTLELALLLVARLWLPLFTAGLALPLACLAAALAARRPERRPDVEPVVPRPARAPAARRVAPAKPVRGTPAPAPAAPELATRPGPAPVAAPPTVPTSLREISDQLRARQEEPSRADVADLLLGRTRRPPKPKLGRYELERELGRGAMGTVYLGRDPRINRVVAVKAIPLSQEFEGDALTEARARFFREAEMAGRLKHPSIVTVHDAGEDGGIAYIAMEFVKGRLLSEHVTSDTLLPAHQVLEIVARIADALDYAHRQDIVHRDIKPANAMFDPGSLETKIMDFGIARLTNQSATRSGIVLGTPSFMAPEQLEGRNVTGRSDLFSLGVTLFQLLAGQLPFRADSMTGLMDKIANAPHPPLRTIRPDLPPCVGAIVDRALQKEPSRRFPTAGEMARALRACARSLAA
jgi:serine/threonine-protein kinase